jgi:hypothetical protein
MNPVSFMVLLQGPWSIAIRDRIERESERRLARGVPFLANATPTTDSRHGRAALSNWARFDRPSYNREGFSPFHFYLGARC